jgi:putative endonuclease
MPKGSGQEAPPGDRRNAMQFWVYMVRCADGTLYTGVARDVGRRLDEHNGLKPRGARYTASRRPVRLAYGMLYATRSLATKEESRIKRLSRAAKEGLIRCAAEKAPPQLIAEVSLLNPIAD